MYMRGILMGPQCRMSILRNHGNVTCRIYEKAMSHVIKPLDKVFVSVSAITRTGRERAYYVDYKALACRI